MAYFSNGTEGMMYEEKWCNRCVHQGGPNGPGCMVWLCHLMYAYEECNNKSNAKGMLDTLIPMKENGFAGECSMFHAKTVEEAEAEAAAYDKANAAELPATQQPNTGPVVMPCMEAWAKARGILA